MTIKARLESLEAMRSPTHGAGRELSQAEWDRLVSVGLDPAGLRFPMDMSAFSLEQLRALAAIRID